MGRMCTRSEETISSRVFRRDRNLIMGPFLHRVELPLLSGNWRFLTAMQKGNSMITFVF